MCQSFVPWGKAAWSKCLEKLHGEKEWLQQEKMKQETNEIAREKFQVKWGAMCLQSFWCCVHAITNEILLYLATVLAFTLQGEPGSRLCCPAVESCAQP